MNYDLACSIAFPSQGKGDREAVDEVKRADMKIVLIFNAPQTTSSVSYADSFPY